MKAKIGKHGPPLQPSAADLEEQAKGLQYSDEYDDIKSFKGSTEKELKCLNTKLTELMIKIDKLAAKIDSIEQYIVLIVI
jgi:peptidoglycan hydrolase CwlO-like protein